MTAAALLPWVKLGAALALAAAAAFLTLAEAALAAASRGRLRAMAEAGARGAGEALVLGADGERLAGGLLVGQALALLLCGGVSAALVLPLAGGWWGAAALAAVALALVVAAEVLPRALAITAPERLAAATAPALRQALPPLAALARGARAAARLVLRACGIRANPEARMTAIRAGIAGAIAQGHSRGAVGRQARDLMMGAFDLAERTVEEVMTHRSRIEMLDADRSPDEILRRVLASSHTRLPLRRGDQENILGVIHAKDLLREADRLVRAAGGDPGAIAGLDAARVAMKPYFVPETTPLDEQMRQFLARRQHFALVVDEYGALRGLITLEDILEEIVGEIADEFDEAGAEHAAVATPEGDWLIDGAMTIRDINRQLDWSLPDDEANTLAGLVIHEARMIPAAGQRFSFHGYRFEVVERRENRLTKLKVRPL